MSYSVLQCVAVCRSVLSLTGETVECVAVCCSVLQCVAVCCRLWVRRWNMLHEMSHSNKTLQHTATHCNTEIVGETVECVAVVEALKRTYQPCTRRRAATHCNTLQHTATHCNTLQHTASHCITLQHISTHCNTLHEMSHSNKTLQHTATHCNTLQHTATHCNTLQHRDCG